MDLLTLMRPHLARAKLRSAAWALAQFFGSAAGASPTHRRESGSRGEGLAHFLHAHASISATRNSGAVVNPSVPCATISDHAASSSRMAASACSFIAYSRGILDTASQLGWSMSAPCSFRWVKLISYLMNPLYTISAVCARGKNLRMA